MTQRLIKLFWFSLLAMVLPSQAAAYFAQAESDARRLLDNPHSTQTPSSDAAYQQLFEQSRSEQSPQSQPVSSTDDSASVVAIINAARWSLSQRTLDDREVSDADSTPLSLSSLPPYKLYCHPVLVNQYWASTSFTPNHRISGWKDTNALYVALNSQFA